MATARDGCVVLTEPLAHLVGGFVASWNRERPATGGRFADRKARERRTETTTISAVSWLAEETRRSDPAGRGVPHDTIQNVVASRYRTTELRVADALVSAIGCPEAFHDGTLTIRPNPSATREARAACCGSPSGVLDAISTAYGSAAPRAPRSIVGA